MAVSLNTAIFDQLNSSEARALHDDSDALSACGVGRIVNLPQIVVVGDESAGKSSVLEALSHVRFPIEAGICTRFATELVLRQSSQTRVSVSIKFADSSKTTHNLQRNDFSAEDLPDIIKDARACMGFPGSKQGFSKDVLRLEIEGPGMYPITLVDMPGLFHAETETQTLEDKKTVDQLVESYMKQKNSIMLVVLAADRPASGQVALTKVKEMDPTRQRTLGVITKPDRVKAMGGDEATVIRLANNQEAVNKLKLGWHVLRNRAEGEASLDERDEVEKRFFESGTWATIPKQNVGIENFRKKLSSVCFEHLRASLPAVVQDIEREIHLRQEELNQLGQGRATMEDQRTYLLSIAGDFQKLARDGIYGRYHESFFGDLDDEERKFRAQLRNFNRVFDYTMRTKGCERRIVSYASDDDEDDEDEDGDEDEDEDDEDDDLPELPEYLETFMEKYPYDFPRPKASSQPALRRELQRQASANQGREFPGSPNQELAIQLFRKQASPWKRIAEFHIDNVMTVAKAFVDELFTHLMGSPRTNKTTERVLTTIVDPFFAEKEQILKDKLSEFLCPYDQGFALPLDVDLHEELEEQSLSRMAGKLFRALSETHPDVFEKDARGGLTKETLAKTVTTNSHMWTDEFATEKVLDMMLAYYEVGETGKCCA
jgi:GTP-binding protein EngB required for normal cell division